MGLKINIVPQRKFISKRFNGLIFIKTKFILTIKYMYNSNNHIYVRLSCYWIVTLICILFINAIYIIVLLLIAICYLNVFQSSMYYTSYK